MIKKTIFLSIALCVTALSTAHVPQNQNRDFYDAVESVELLTARLKDIVINCAQKCKMPGMDKTKACTSSCVDKELDILIGQNLGYYLKRCQGDPVCAYKKIKETNRRAQHNLNYMIDEALNCRLK